MNVKQMHTGIRLGVQKMDSAELDDMLPQEIDYYLNRAVDRFIDEQYSYIKNEDRDISGHLVNDNLNTLIRNNIIDNMSGGLAVSSLYPNTLSGNITAGDVGYTFRHYLFGRIKIEDGWRNLRYVQPKGLKAYLQVEDNTPIFREYPLTIENNVFHVVGDSRITLSTNNHVHLKFIINPSEIDFLNNKNSDLPPHTHKTIIDIALQEIIRDLRLGDPQ